MKSLLIALTLFFTAAIWAGELPLSSRADQVSEKELANEVLLPRIDTKYRAGGYLIYDCEDQHFICVDGRGFEQCDLSREASRERGRLILACSPLRRFSSFELCLEELYQLMHQASSKAICLNPKSI